MKRSPELVSGEITTRSIRKLPVSPSQLSFPCVESIYESRNEKENKKTGKKTVYSRYYLSNKDLSPQQSLPIIREHWSIENKNHYSRDTTFQEDRYRYKTGNTSANLSLLRGISLSLWKKHYPDKTGKAFLMYNQFNIDEMTRKII